jgi:hypothetical protein
MVGGSGSRTVVIAVIRVVLGYKAKDASSPAGPWIAPRKAERGRMGVMRSVEAKEVVVYVKGSRVRGLKISSTKAETGPQPQPSKSVCFPLSLLDTTACVVVSEISEGCTNRLNEKAAFAECLGASARSKDEARCCNRRFRSE